MANQDILPLLMQGLPQELYDTFYDLVFTADQEERFLSLGRDYKPPAQLQIDRASRERFADSYYGGGALFAFAGPVDIKWANSLVPAHFSKINRVRCRCLVRGCSDVDAFFAEYTKAEMQRLSRLSNPMNGDDRDEGHFHDGIGVTVFAFKTREGDLVYWQASVGVGPGGGIVFKKFYAADSE